MSQQRSTTNTITFGNAKIYPLCLLPQSPQQKAQTQNQLPVNLFHSTTSYNKMLITYGKNRKKNISQITDGIITSLEYVNDQIFNKQIHQRQLTKHKQYYSMNQYHQEANQERCFQSKHQGKQSRSNNIQPKHNNTQSKHNNLPKYAHSRKTTSKHDNCNCCCCQEFCKECANTTAKCCQISESVLTNAKQTIDQQIMLAKQRKTISYNSKPKISKTNINNQRNTNIDHQRNINIDHQRNSKINSKVSAVSQKAYSSIDVNKRYNKQRSLQNSKSSTKKKIDISHLLIKNLIQFNQQKKNAKQHQLIKQQQKQAQLQFISQLNDQIRQKNLSYSRNRKAISSQKSLSKQTIGVQYWERIKNQVMDSIKSDNYSKTLKKQLNQFQFFTYQHKDIKKRQLTMTQDEIQYQRRIRQQEANMRIKMKQMEKMSKAKIIEKNLRHLQSNRIHHIKSCKKRNFQPTPDVIQNAFKNTIEPQNKPDIQIFKNQKLKKTHNKKVRN